MLKNPNVTYYLKSISLHYSSSRNQFHEGFISSNNCNLIKLFIANMSRSYAHEYKIFKF